MLEDCAEYLEKAVSALDERIEILKEQQELSSNSYSARPGTGLIQSADIFQKNLKGKAGGFGGIS